MAAERILVTGADGYIGGLICDRLLKDTDAHILLWVRADDVNELKQKYARLLERYVAYKSRIEIHAGNLRVHEPFESIAPISLDRIIHVAAVTAFNVEEETANAVNRDGTRKLLEFARQCPQLKRLCYVSTAYASGLTSDVILEQPVSIGTVFANHYERSKCEAESLLHNDFNDLPWHIYRVATVIAHDDSGSVGQYNVFHNTMQLLFYGLISMLPGLEKTSVYLVTGEFVANTIAELSVKVLPERLIFNVCYSYEEAVSIGRIVDICFDVFASDEGFSKRRILRPLFTDLESFELLAEGLSGLSGQIVVQAVDSIRPFAPQLFIEKQIRNDRLREMLTNYPAVEPEALIRNTVRHLVQTRWGREARMTPAFKPSEKSASANSASTFAEAGAVS